MPAEGIPNAKPVGRVLDWLLAREMWLTGVNGWVGEQQLKIRMERHLVSVIKGSLWGHREQNKHLQTSV